MDKYRYLGLVIDNKLAWHEITDGIIKKVHCRLFCLRKLRSLRVREDILDGFFFLFFFFFFLSTVSSVLTHGCVCWGGNASKQGRDRLEKTTRKAGEVTVGQQETGLTESVTDDLPTVLTRRYTSFETSV